MYPLNSKLLAMNYMDTEIRAKRNGMGNKNSLRELVPFLPWQGSCRHAITVPTSGLEQGP